MTASTVEFALNLIGLFAFALSGAMLAVRQQFDLVGMAVLASITALGGGIIRDAMMGDLPVAALRNTWWLVVPLVATVYTFFLHPQVARLRRAVLAPAWAYLARRFGGDSGRSVADVFAQ